MRLQPGVRRILTGLPIEARILDLGCGNGELWRALAESGHQGNYVGLDSSDELLQIAVSSKPPSKRNSAIFIQADISATDWEAKLPEIKFDVILAFAVLHHIPGGPLRSRILRTVHRLLAPGGVYIHSVWQFLNSARLQKRIQPWERIDLRREQVDSGDCLLDWRRGGYGLRYVHHFTDEELALLANMSGFHIESAFLSDGEGGKLGLYQIWKAV